jgi:hypothetical protein
LRSLCSILRSRFFWAVISRIASELQYIPLVQRAIYGRPLHLPARSLRDIVRSCTNDIGNGLLLHMSHHRLAYRSSLSDSPPSIAPINTPSGFSTDSTCNMRIDQKGRRGESGGVFPQHTRRLNARVQAFMMGTPSFFKWVFVPVSGCLASHLPSANSRSLALNQIGAFQMVGAPRRPANYGHSLQVPPEGSDQRLKPPGGTTGRYISRKALTI